MAAVAGLVLVSFVHFRERPREVEPMRFQIAMPENTAPTPLGALTVSPDALRLPSPLSRMAGRNFGCGPDSVEARPLPGPQSAWEPPFWRPDSPGSWH
jgi:hypothetical protein